MTKDQRASRTIRVREQSRLSVDIPEDLHTRLDVAAARLRIKKKVLVIECLEKCVKEIEEEVEKK